MFFRSRWLALSRTTRRQWMGVVALAVSMAVVAVFARTHARAKARRLKERRWIESTLPLRPDLPHPPGQFWRRAPRKQVVSFREQKDTDFSERLDCEPPDLLNGSSDLSADNYALRNRARIALGVLSSLPPPPVEVRLQAFNTAWNGYEKLGHLGLVKPLTDWILAHCPACDTLYESAADAYEACGENRRSCECLLRLVKPALTKDRRDLVVNTITRLLKEDLVPADLLVLARRADQLTEQLGGNWPSTFADGMDICRLRDQVWKRLGRKPTHPAVDYFASRDWTDPRDWKDASKYIARFVLRKCPDPLDTLGPFAVHDINRDGRLELLVLNICDGTGGYHDLWLCKQKRGSRQFWSQTIPFARESLAEVHDLDGDGVLEIESDSNPHGGGLMIGGWHDVYRWNPALGRYEDASSHYLQFYKTKVLPDFQCWAADPYPGYSLEAKNLLRDLKHMLRACRNVRPQYPYRPKPSPLHLREPVRPE